MPGRTKGSPHSSRFQTLIDYLIALGDSDAVVLDFARIKALTEYPLSVSMHIGGSTWTSATAAPMWRIHFARDAEVKDG